MTEGAGYKFIDFLLVAIFSGLLGSIITVIFNYKIRLSISQKEHKRRTERLCFLSMVKIVSIVAADAVFRGYIDAKAMEYRGKDMHEEIEDIDKSFSLRGHDFDFYSFFIAGIVNWVKSESLKNPDKTRIIGKRLTNSLSSGIYDFKIEDDLLADLPNDAIVEFHTFQTHLTGVKNAASFWTEYTKNLEVELITVETILAQWESILGLTESALKLMDVLIREGDINRTEADTILYGEIHRQNVFVWSYEQSKEKFEKASQFIEKRFKAISAKEP